MKRPSPLISIGLRYGLIAGALSGVLLIAMFYIGRHPLMVSPFMDFRILLYGVFIFFSLREFRDYHQEGSLYFSQGMICSFIFVIIAGALSSIIVWTFCSLEPNFILSYVRALTEYLNTFSAEDIKRIGKEVFNTTLKELPSTTGMQIVGKYFIQGIMIGFFVSIILSVILRKEPKQ